MSTLKAFLSRFVVVAAACGFIAAVGCQNPDEFHRFGAAGSAGSGMTGVGGDTGAGGDPAGGAGTGGGPVGTAGTTGAAGTTGVAGTTGAAGTTGVAGSGAAGTTGGAGSGPAGASGRGGTGPAGAGGRGGAAAGAGGRGGAAGGAAGRGGAAGGAAGRGGSGAGGTAGRGTDKIQVVAKCGQDGSSTSAITLTLKIYNLEASDKQWGDIKIRYYFTSDGMAPVVEFDYLQNTTWNNDKTNLIVTPTGSYVEIGFKPTAGTLFAFDNIAGSGDMQMRIHPADYHSTWNPSQADDHSFMACPGTAFMPRMGIAGFYMGQLAWGTTP